MNENPRPSTLGEILDRTAQVYRRNFLLFAGVAALPIGTMMAIGVLGGGFALAVGAAARGMAWPQIFAGGALALMLLVALPVYLVAYVYSTAGLTQAAASTYRGEKTTIGATLRSVTPRFWRYLGFLLLQALLVVLIPGAIAGVLIGIPIYLASSGGVGLAGGVAVGVAMVLVIPAVVIAVVWLLLSYGMGMAVCVVEQKTALESLNRAMKLSRGTRGRIFVMFLLVLALTMVVAMIADIPVLIVAGLGAAAAKGTHGAASAVIVAEMVNVVVNFSLQTLLAPVTWIALLLFYFDQRIRTEGYDIEWMMEQAGLTHVAQQAPTGEPTMISGTVLPADSVEER